MKWNTSMTTFWNFVTCRLGKAPKIQSGSMGKALTSKCDIKKLMVFCIYSNCALNSALISSLDSCGVIPLTCYNTSSRTSSTIWFFISWIIAFLSFIGTCLWPTEVYFSTRLTWPRVSSPLCSTHTLFLNVSVCSSSGTWDKLSLSCVYKQLIKTWNP